MNHQEKRSSKFYFEERKDIKQENSLLLRFNRN